MSPHYISVLSSPIFLVIFPPMDMVIHPKTCSTQALIADFTRFIFLALSLIGRKGLADQSSCVLHCSCAHAQNHCQAVGGMISMVWNQPGACEQSFYPGASRLFAGRPRSLSDPQMTYNCSANYSQNYAVINCFLIFRSDRI